MEVALYQLTCDSVWRGGPPPIFYARQYYGAFAGERRVVVAQLFDPSWTESADWKDELVYVDDGGWGFVLVVFDPATREVLTIRPNGSA